MNAYLEMKSRHQKEINAFPMQFAFSKEQFAEGMKNLGLDPTDTDKVASIGMGGFLLKTDAPKFTEMMNRIEKETQAAIDADPTGEGFIFDMFKYELANHEYVVTGCASDTLDALGYTWEEINADPRLKRGLHKAIEAQQTEYCGW